MRKLLAAMFAFLSIADLYLMLFTSMPYALFYFVFSIYFAYRAKQLWSQDA